MTVLGEQAKAMIGELMKEILPPCVEDNCCAECKGIFAIIKTIREAARSVPSASASPGLREAAREVVEKHRAWKMTGVMERLEEMLSGIDALRSALEAEEGEPRTTDDAFIRHIQTHLKPGEEVICKICGKTAREICDREVVSVPSAPASPGLREAAKAVAWSVEVDIRRLEDSERRNSLTEYGHGELDGLRLIDGMDALRSALDAGKEPMKKVTMAEAEILGTIGLVEDKSDGATQPRIYFRDDIAFCHTCGTALGMAEDFEPVPEPPPIGEGEREEWEWLIKWLDDILLCGDIGEPTTLDLDDLKVLGSIRSLILRAPLLEAVAGAAMEMFEKYNDAPYEVARKLRSALAALDKEPK